MTRFYLNAGALDRWIHQNKAQYTGLTLKVFWLIVLSLKQSVELQLSMNTT